MALLYETRERIGTDAIFQAKKAVPFYDEGQPTNTELGGHAFALSLKYIRSNTLFKVYSLKYIGCQFCLRNLYRVILRITCFLCVIIEFTHQLISSEQKPCAYDIFDG